MFCRVYDSNVTVHFVHSNVAKIHSRLPTGWLLTNPDYLILDEPTRGIDIGTKTEIQKLVLDLADQGMAVTFISSEVEEMLRTCSRMAVLRDGQKVGELEEDELSQSGVMKAIAGGDDK